MKTKHVIIVFLLSVFFAILGVFGKLNEWRYEGNFFMISNGLWVLGILLGLVKLVTDKKLKEIMNE